MTAATTPGPSGRAPAFARTTTSRSVPQGRNAQPSRRSHRPSAAVFWRRRFVAVGLALSVLGVARQAGAALGGVSLATPERHPPVGSPYVVHVVQPGDTLWSIAEALAPDRDPREVVDLLRDARDSDTLVPGETITWVPE